MVSLPLLGLLWSALRQVVEKAEEWFKCWIKPAPCTLLEGVALIGSGPNPNSSLKMRSYANTHCLGTAGETSGFHIV